MNRHNKAEKPGNRCEPVLSEKYGLVSDVLDFTKLLRCGFSVCMCVL